METIAGTQSIFDPQLYRRVRQPMLAAEGLPPWCYTSPEFYDREVERIFRKSWNFIGRADEIAKPGDFMVFDLVGESIIVLRDGAGRLRGFANSCRHRGTRLLDGGSRIGKASSSSILPKARRCRTISATCRRASRPTISPTWSACGAGNTTSRATGSSISRTRWRTITRPRFIENRLGCRRHCSKKAVSAHGIRSSCRRRRRSPYCLRIWQARSRRSVG